jgi:hypothetical protein
MSLPAPASYGSPRERRDFFWLLNVLQECCPALEPEQLEAKPARGPGNRSESVQELVKRLHAESLIGKFGFKIPDTVIIRSGKPRKRFSMDGHGRMQGEPLNSSAQLLRILRRYVQQAQKRPALAPVYNPRAKQAQSPSMHGSTSEPSLPKAGASTFPTPGAGVTRAQHFKRMRGAEPFREAAVLHYNDGAVRYMTTNEALKQMENVSRLPKEFWQHVVMLQTPIPVNMSKSTTRYITYCYDASSGVLEPQAPLSLVHRRSNSITRGEVEIGQEPALVGAIPRKINEALAEKKGRYGKSTTLQSGRFEFVLDEGDGTLWLVNADRLVVMQEKAQVENVQNEENEEIKYFREEDFRESVEEQEKNYEGLKQRWEVQEISKYECLEADGWQVYEQSVNSVIAEAARTRRGNVQVQLNSQMHDIDLNLMKEKNNVTGALRDVRLSEGAEEQDGGPAFELVSRNAADRLAGVKSPDELLKYYQAESKMLKHYYVLKAEEEQAYNQKKKAGGAGPSMGLCIWFKRWVKVHKGKRVSATPGDTRSARQEPAAKVPGQGGRPRARTAPGQLRQMGGL